MKNPNKSKQAAICGRSRTYSRKFMRRNLIAILLVANLVGFFAAPANAWFGNDVVNTVVNTGRDLNRERKEEQERLERAAREAAEAARRAAEAVAKEASRINEERKRAQEAAERAAKEAANMLADECKRLNEVRKHIEKKVAENARESAANIGSGRFGAALESAGQIVNDVVPNAGNPVIAVANAGEDATREAKIANRDAHNGRFGAAGEHFGQALSKAGEGITVFEPETGVLVIAAGQGTKATAQQGERANTAAHDIAEGKFGEAANAALVKPAKEAVKETKLAADEIGNGRFGKAAEHIGQASESLSSGSGVGIIDAAHAGEASSLQLRESAQEAKNGRFGATGQKLGDAVSNAGEAIAQVDSEKSKDLKETGNEIKEKSEQGQIVAREIRKL